MNDETFKFLRILVWALPAGIAYNTWGLNVALLTFGCQMFSAGPLTRMWAMYKLRKGEEVEPADAQKAFLVMNVVAGVGYAFFIQAVVGGEPPGPISFGD